MVFDKCLYLSVYLLVGFYLRIIKAFHHTMVSGSPRSPSRYFFLTRNKRRDDLLDLRFRIKCRFYLLFVCILAFLKFRNANLDRKLFKICIRIRKAKLRLQRLTDRFVINSLAVPFSEKCFSHLCIRLSQDLTLHQFPKRYPVDQKICIFFLTDLRLFSKDTVLCQKFFHSRMAHQCRKDIGPVTFCLRAHAQWK